MGTKHRRRLGAIIIAALGLVAAASSGAQAQAQAVGQDGAPIRFTPSDIQLTGATVLGPETIEAVIGRYRGRPLQTEDLAALRQELTLAYVEAGYFTSGVVIDDQDLDGDTFLLRAIEGRLTTVAVSGLSEGGGWGRPRRAVIDRHLSSLRDTPINGRRLEAAFRSLSEDPSFASVDGRLEAGAALGEGVLQLDVEPARPFFGGFSLANDRSPAIGSVRAALTAGVRNPIGYGETLSLNYGATEGAQDAEAQLHVPLPWRSAEAHARIAWSDSEVIEPPFTALDLLTDSWVFNVGGSAAVIERPQFDVRVGFDLERIETQTSIFGLDISLAPGARNGATEFTVLRLSQEALFRGARRFISLNSTLSLGLDAIEPDFRNAVTPNESFYSWRGGATFVRRMTATDQRFTARVTTQIATEPQFAVEKFALGGPESVRGYRTNRFVQDAGVAATVAYEAPITDLGVPPGVKLFTFMDTSDIRAVGFADAGAAWNSDQVAFEGNDLASVGAGLRWEPKGGRLSAAVEFAHGLTNLPDVPNPALQDDGVTFRLAARF